MGWGLMKKFRRELFWSGKDTDKHLPQMVGGYFVFRVNDLDTSPVILLIGTSYVTVSFFIF